MIFDRQTVFLNQAWKITLPILALVILSYFFLDQPLAWYFHHASKPVILCAKAANFLTSPNLHFLLWPLLFYFVRFLFKNPSLGNRALFIAVAVDLSYVLSFPMKVVLGRLRPKLLFTEHLYGFDFFSFHSSDLSLPSAHATAIAAVMSSLACFYPRYSYYLAAAGFFLAFSRVVLGEHYLSDVMVGTYIGMIVAQTVYLTMRWEEQRRSK